jgi:rhodanese-related sulfurtransferase
MSPTLYRTLDNNTSTRILKVDYNDLSFLLSQESCMVIDVRNPEQVEIGTIPGSVNIPLSDLKNACMLDEDEFLSKYNVPKPSKEDVMLVLSGLGPNQAMTAFEIAYKSGYKKSTQYAGGWPDWIKNENQLEEFIESEMPLLNY